MNKNESTQNRYFVYNWFGTHIRTYKQLENAIRTADKHEGYVLDSTATIMHSSASYAASLPLR